MSTMDMDKTGDNPPSLIQSALSGIPYNVLADNSLPNKLGSASYFPRRRLTPTNLSSPTKTHRRISRCLTRYFPYSMNLISALSRKLDLSKTTLDSSFNSPSRQVHANSMLNLDREKFSLAKNINELESGSHALETTLARLKEELENVGNDDEANKENENTDDATLFDTSLT
jgi:Spc24 subunit of Ndc80